MKEVTQTQINEWKKKHGNVYLLEVEGRKAYLKSPDRKTLGYAGSVGQKNPMKFNEIMLENCWLGGDEEIKTNDSFFLAAASKLAELIDVKKASLVKI